MGSRKKAGTAGRRQGAAAGAQRCACCPNPAIPQLSALDPMGDPVCANCLRAGILCFCCKHNTVPPRLKDLSINQGAAVCESCFADTFGEHCLLCGEAWLIEAGGKFVPASFRYPYLEGRVTAAVCMGCFESKTRRALWSAIGFPSDSPSPA